MLAAWMIASSLALAGGTLYPVNPDGRRAPVLLVTTPAFPPEAFEPLAEALGRRRHPVYRLDFPCEGGVEDLVQATVEAGRTVGEKGELVVVAHGLGATLALQAAPRMEAERLVLLAPLLGVGRSAAHGKLADLPVSGSVSLGGTVPFGDGDLAEVLLGSEAPELGCLSEELVHDLRAWADGGTLPLPLAKVETPVWIGISLGDAFAPVEAVVPPSRRLPDRELIRMGLDRFDPQDFSHVDMLTHPIPVRQAVRAASR